MPKLDPVDTERRFYSPATAAASLGVSTAWVYQEIKNGRIDAIKIGQGRKILIPTDAVDAYCNLLISEARRAG